MNKFLNLNRFRLRLFRYSNLVLLSFLLFQILSGFAYEGSGQQVKPQENENQIYIGFAKQEITPPIGTPLSGYGRRQGEPSIGVADPLYARAVALNRDQEFFVFVSVDLVLIDRYFRSEIFRKISKEISIRENQLVLFATHTHSGSGAIGKRFWEKFIMGKYNKDLFNTMTNTISNTAIQALSQKLPVAVQFGEKRIDEFIANRMDSNLSHPSWLRILQFRNPSQVLARLVFMPAHPTILSSSNYSFSAGFPGRFLELLEAESPDSIALFANGAAGDRMPNVKEQATEIETMKSYAHSLYGKFSSIIWKSVDLNGPWKGETQEIKLPPVKIRWSKMKIPSWFGGTLFPRKTNLQIIRLGSFVIPAVPAEMGSEVGLAVENQVKSLGLQPLLIGYANDYLGYIIPRRYYLNRKFYESRASFYGPKMDWFLLEKIESQLNSLLTQEERKMSNPPGILSYNDLLPVLKLKGSPYHRGFEEGRLLKEEVKQIYHQIFHYLRSQLPIPGVNRLLINTFLDRTWKKLEPYVTYAEFRQMQGLSDSTGIPLKNILRVHAIPEVLPTWCSNGAYWGPATTDTRLIAIRNLDWNREIGVHNAAAVKFHQMPGQNDYVNIGYYGFLGVLSGLNEAGISVGQIGATSIDEARDGVPMPFLLKRILANTNSLEDVVKIFEESKLTQGFNYVIADASEKKAIAIEATHNHMAVFLDNDPKEHSVDYSLPVSNAVFRGDPAMDPTIRNLQLASHGDPKSPGLEPPEGKAYTIRYLKHGNLVKQYFGSIDAEIAKSIAREISPPSNIQSVVYAFPEFWVANSKGELRATDCQYHYFDFKSIGQE